MRTRSQRPTLVQRYAAPLATVAGGSALLKPIGRGALVQAWPSPGLPSRIRRRLGWLVLGSILVAAFALTLAALAWVNRPREATLSDLIAALPHPRPFVARLSGGFPLGATDRPGLDRAFERYLRRQPETTRLHLRAQSALAAGGSGSVLDGAVRDLEAASAVERHNGAIYSDLALAYAARAAEEDQPRDLIGALTAATKAVGYAPGLPQARFQYAEALTRFSLRSQAIPAWEAYLEEMPLGSDPYAEARLAKLREPTALERWPESRKELVDAALAGRADQAAAIVREHPAGALEEAETTILGAWADAASERDSATAGKSLGAARIVGEALAAENGDFLLLDAVDWIEGARHNASRCLLLAKGLRDYAEGMRSIAAQNYGAAHPKLLAASGALDSVGSRFALRADFQLGLTTFYQPDYETAAALFQEVLRKVNARREGLLAAASLRMLGLVHRQRADHRALISVYRQALALSERAHDRETAADTHRLLAGTLQDVGQPEAAWHHGFEALQAAGRFRSARALISFFGRSGDSLAAQGEIQAALLFQNEAVYLAEKHGSPLEQVVATRSRSQVLARAGEGDRAVADLEAAWAAWRRIEDGKLKTSARAEILRAEGDLPLGEDLDARLQRQTQALEFFRATGKATYLPDGYAARARVELALGDVAAAESDFRAGVAEVERQRQTISAEETRITHLGLTRRARLFTDLVELLALRRGATDEAFAAAEAGRARALLDRLDPAGADAAELASTPNHLRAIQEALASDSALVFYAALPRQLLAWRITQEETRLFVLPVPEDELAVGVRELREAIARGEDDDDLRRRSGQLFQSVLAPLLEGWPVPSRVAFVPDGPLLGLPFSALYDEDTQHFLVERTAVVLAPSARVFVEACQRQRRRSTRQPSTLLAVGVNEADREQYPHLQPLRAAEREASHVADLYPQGALLLGADATVLKVVASARDFELLHFSGHAVANDSYPNLSSLALASGPGVSGALKAHQIAELDLRKTRLVVLASCRSGYGPRARGEGVLSLARAFLAAGSAAVAATLWDLDDGDSADLFLDFHRRVAAGTEPAEALRRTQVELIHSADENLRSPRLWASVALVGGSHGQDTDRMR